MCEGHVEQVMAERDSALADLSQLQKRHDQLWSDFRGLESTLEEVESELEQEAMTALQKQGVEAPAIVINHLIHIRYEGTDSAIPVPKGTLTELRERFEKEHKNQFGFIFSIRFNPKSSGVFWRKLSAGQH